MMGSHQINHHCDPAQNKNIIKYNKKLKTRETSGSEAPSSVLVPLCQCTHYPQKQRLVAIAQTTAKAKCTLIQLAHDCK